MYQLIVRRHVRRIFDGLSRGDYQTAVAGLDPDVHHRFAGDHALGGERHSRAGVEQWFARLFRLFRLDFTVDRVAVSGPPWDMVVTVEWRASVTPRQGPTYVNRGAHVLRMRRARVVELHAYEDSQAVRDALELMAAHGVEEARAAPITA